VALVLMLGVRRGEAKAENTIGKLQNQ
jgi:hypothetical protein